MDIRRLANVGMLIFTFTAGVAAAAGLISLAMQGSIWTSFTVMVAAVALLGSLVSLEFALYMLLLLGLTEGIYKTMAPSLFTLAAKDAMLVMILVRLLYGSIRSRDFSWIKQRLSAPAVLLTGYVTALGAAPSTSSPALALAGIRSWLLWLPLYYPAWVIFDSRRKILRLLHIMCAVSVPICLYGIYQRQAGYAHLQAVEELYRHSLWYTGRALSVFNSPHLFGSFAALVVLVSLGLSFYHRKSSHRLLFIGCAVLAAGGVMAADVRGAFLGLAFGVVMFLILARRKTAIAVVVAIVALLSWNYVAPEDTEGTSKIRDQTSLQIVTSRVMMPLERALEQVTEYPLGYGVATGAGTGRIFGHLRSRAAPRDITWVENEFGRALVEIGLPGFFFYIWLLWTATRSAIRATRTTKHDRDHYVMLGMTCGMLLVLLKLATGGALYDAAAGIYFWVFAAATTRLAELAADEQAEAEGAVDEADTTAAEDRSPTAAAPAIASAARGIGQ